MTSTIWQEIRQRCAKQAADQCPWTLRDALKTSDVGFRPQAQWSCQHLTRRRDDTYAFDAANDVVHVIRARKVGRRTVDLAFM